MPKISVKFLFLVLILGMMMLIGYYNYEISQLNTQLNNSAKKVVSLELSEKRLESEIERKNARLEDVKNWISDSRTYNITLKKSILYLVDNKTKEGYAVRFFNDTSNRAGYTYLNWDLFIRNGMTIKEIYRVCVHELNHNSPEIGRNEDKASEFEDRFNNHCFALASYIIEERVKQNG